MTNIGSLLQTPEKPYSASTVTHPFRDIEQDGAQLLELRTDTGAVYVRPSRWQRIRLQWTFRHFHVLAPQVLSRSDQRLIEKLSRSAVVTPTLPVASNTVFGVVEKVRSKSPASANRVVTLRTELSSTQAFLTKPQIPRLPNPGSSVGVKLRETRGVRDAGFQQWGALGALVTVCLAVILASVYGIPLFSSLGQMRNPGTLSTPIEHAANHGKPADLRPAATRPLPVSPATASLPKAEKPKRWVAPLPPAPVLVQQEPAALANESGQFISSLSAGPSPVPTLDTVPDTILAPAPIALSASSERRFVSELPQGYFAHPVVSERNLVGDLRLKALIGADGSVKEVTVLSGDPKLAEVGMRAVRQWHYSPYQVLGNPVEVETQIKMSFFGQDAVSIASVADRPTSELK